MGCWHEPECQYHAVGTTNPGIIAGQRAYISRIMVPPCRQSSHILITDPYDTPAIFGTGMRSITYKSDAIISKLRATIVIGAHVGWARRSGGIKS